MSSFSVPPLHSGVEFNVAPFIDGMQHIAESAGHFPDQVAQHIDGPMRKAAEQVGAHAHKAGESIHEGMEHGLLLAESTLRLFPAIVVEAIESPTLAAMSIIKEAFERTFEFIKDAFAEIGKKSLDIGLGAEKAGVSVEYFSRLTEAGKTVNVAQEQISTGFKLLQKNAVDASEGVKQSEKSFTDLGISMDFVKAHLNDNEGLWQAVQERIGSLESPAERSRRAMEVLGRQGADIVPLLQMSADKMKELGDVAERLGVIESAESAEFGKKWKQMTVQIGEAWEGMKRRLLEPIMEVIANHWETDFLPTLLKMADVIGELIPQALEIMRQAFIAFEPVMEAQLALFERFAEVSDAIGNATGGQFGTTGLADTIHSASDNLYEVKVSLEHMHFHADGKGAKHAGEEAGKKVEETVLAAQRRSAEHRNVARQFRGGH